MKNIQKKRNLLLFGGEIQNLRGEISSLKVLKKTLVTIQHILIMDLSFLTCFTGYLCPLEANTYNIEFTRFKLRDMDSQAVLFEICKPPDEELQDADLPPDASRFVRYQFPPDFLKLKTVGAT